MASRLTRIEDKLLTQLQKLKIQIYERTGRTVSTSEVIQMIVDQDLIILNLLTNQQTTWGGL